MKRSDQLEFCSRCKHKKMNFKRGLLCGYTDEFADFDESCDKFEVQEEVQTTNQDRIIFVDSLDENKNPYWQKLGWFVLAAIVYLILSIITYRINALESLNDVTYEEDVSPFVFWGLHIVSTLLFWVFVGWELKKVRPALISCAVQVISYTAVHFFSETDLIFFSQLPFVFSMISFAYLCDFKHKTLWIFLGVSALANIGLVALNFSSANEFTESFNNLLRIGDIRRDHSFFIGTSVESDGRTRTVSLDYLFSNFFRMILLFITVTYSFKALLIGRKKFQVNVVSLVYRISKAQMVMLLIIFYIGLTILSLGLLGIPLTYFWLEKVAPEYLSEILGLTYILNLFIFFISGFMMLLFLSWLYRKIVMEFYLSHHKGIGWNYFLGQIPLIGIIVWLVNLIDFDRPKHLSSIKISKLVKFPSDTLPSIIITLSILGAVLNLIFEKEFDTIVIASYLISIALLILYVFSKSGLYIIICFQLILFVILMMLQNTSFEIPTEIISFFFFYTIVRYIVIYPAFHSKIFRVKMSNIESRE